MINLILALTSNIYLYILAEISTWFGVSFQTSMLGDLGRVHSRTISRPILRLYLPQRLGIPNYIVNYLGWVFVLV
jgi:hypothetical protein